MGRHPNAMSQPLIIPGISHAIGDGIDGHRLGMTGLDRPVFKHHEILAWHTSQIERANTARAARLKERAEKRILKRLKRERRRYDALHRRERSFSRGRTRRRDERSRSPRERRRADQSPSRELSPLSTDSEEGYNDLGKDNHGFRSLAKKPTWSLDSKHYRQPSKQA